jgi:hypothetical protein
MRSVLEYQNLSARLQGKRSLHLLAKLWHFVLWLITEDKMITILFKQFSIEGNHANL